MLSNLQIELIQSTVPVLREQSVAITQAMYRRMFTDNPEVARMFNPSHMHPGGQTGALAGAIVAYAEHLRDLDALKDALAVIVHKHVALQVQPEQYAIVGGHLLAAITEVLDDAATPELMAAWAEAYGFLAGVCIDAEKAIYTAQTEVPKGWSGLREFVVTKKRMETPNIASLWVRPSDGGELPTFAPGQHVSVALPGADDLALRQYSLAQAPGGDRWRLTIKAEPACQVSKPGVVSNRIVRTLEQGTTLLLSMPSGSFVFDPHAGEHPIALLAGGVGITPIFSMVASSVAAKPERPVLLIHAAIDKRSRPLDGELRELAAAHSSVDLVCVHERPAADERIGHDYHRKGRVDQHALRELLPSTSSERATLEVWTCGPHGFMASVDAALEALGIASERRHFEFFGPARALRGCPIG